MTSATTTQIPGYLTGTWDIDPVHSDISFTVRHMMVTITRHFRTSAGNRHGPHHARRAPCRSTRAHRHQTTTRRPIRSADFFAVDEHRPGLRATGVRVHGRIDRRAS